MTRPTPIDDAPHQEAAMSSPAPETHFARRPWLLALVLVVVTFAAYQPTWHAGFIWDDDDHLTANPAMTAPHGLKLIWSSLAVGRYYPLTLTTFWAQRRLWGLHPLPYHLVNVLLHAANGVLVFFILRRLRIPGGLAGRDGVGAPPGQCRIGGVDHRTQEHAIGIVLFSGCVVFSSV